MKNVIERTIIVLLILCVVGLVSVPILKDIKFGLDLKGGFEVLYQVETIDGSDLNSSIMSNTSKTLSKRIDVLGVSEPSIIIEGNDKIRVQLAGVTNPEEARKVLGKAANLTFRNTSDELLMPSSVLKAGGARISEDSYGNPAVSLAMYLSKKMTLKEFLYYVVAQVLGALAGTAILYLILKNTTLGVANLGANGYASLSTLHITLFGAIVTEVILTFIFIYTILGVTSDESKGNIAGLVIGLTLAFVHLLGIKLTGTSVNPARSLAPAIFMCGEAFKQVWVFILSPLVGAALATYVFKYLNTSKKKSR